MAMISDDQNHAPAVLTTALVPLSAPAPGPATADNDMETDFDGLPVVAKFSYNDDDNDDDEINFLTTIEDSSIFPQKKQRKTTKN